jgi:hypothetical protein
MFAATILATSIFSFKYLFMYLAYPVHHTHYPTLLIVVCVNMTSETMKVYAAGNKVSGVGIMQVCWMWQLWKSPM